MLFSHFFLLRIHLCFMSTVVIYYEGPKNEFFQEKVMDLAHTFKGQIKRSFSLDQNEMSAILVFPSSAQDERFQEHCQEMAKTLSVKCSFGGYVEL